MQFPFSRRALKPLSRPSALQLRPNKLNCFGASDRSQLFALTETRPVVRLLTEQLIKYCHS